MKRGIIIIIIILGFVIFIALNFGIVSAALGVSPAKIEFNFVPGFEHTFDYRIISDKEDGEVLLYAEGDLAEYVTLSRSKVVGGGGLKVFLNLPENLNKPGENKIFIVAEEVPDESSFLGTAIIVKAVIKIFVPFPGRYAEVVPNIPDINIGENLPVEVNVINRGRETLTVDTKVEIYNNEGNLIDTVTFDSREIVVGENQYFRKLFNSTKLTAGDYNAVAVVDYGPETNSANTSFRVGSLFVEVLNHTGILYNNQKIQKFFIDIQSRWNSDIDSIFADVRLEGVNFTSFRTPPVDLKAWEVKEIETFVELEGLDPGKYKANIDLRYEGVNSSYEGEVLIKGGSEYNLAMILVILGVLIAVLVVLVVLRKKKNGKK